MVRSGPGITKALDRGAAHGFLAKGSAAVVALVTQVVLARILGTAGFGDFAYVMAWVAILAPLCVVGADAVVVRFVAQYRALQRQDLLRGVQAFALRLALLGGVVTTAIAFGAVGVFGASMTISLRMTFVAGLAALPVLSVLRTTTGVLQGRRQVLGARLPEFVVQPLLLAGIVAAIAIVGIGVTAPTAAAVNSATLAIASIAAAWWLRRSGGNLPTLTPRQAEYRHREWLEVALPLALVSGFALANQRADVLILGTLAGTREAGIYSAAARISGLVLWGQEAVNLILGPIASQMATVGSRPGLRLAAQRAVAISVAFAIPAIVVLVGSGEWLLSIFGPDFREGYPAMMVLLIGHGFSALAGSVGFLLMMTGHHRVAAAGMTAALTANVVLGIILVPRFGMIGAATAAAGSAVVLNTVLYVTVRARLGVDPSVAGLFGRLQGRPR